jgi:hypothetical protein
MGRSARTWRAAHCPLAVHNPKISSEVHYCLKATADDGTEIYLGDLWLPRKTITKEAMGKLMDAYWDERLDTADCTPGCYTIPG